MAIQLNHTIVAARDKDISATFLTEILGLPAPILVGPFAVVTVMRYLAGLYERRGIPHQCQRRDHVATLCISW